MTHNSCPLLPVGLILPLHFNYFSVTWFVLSGCFNIFCSFYIFSTDLIAIVHWLHPWRLIHIRSVIFIILASLKQEIFFNIDILWMQIPRTVICSVMSSFVVSYLKPVSYFIMIILHHLKVLPFLSSELSFLHI